ncbi:MAG: nickel pincer cofactor biosynthesis protein LarC, partial [Gammaproteobacteria bacterium]|nr:nickel pincer cofactor biosynthesis protein LarC [Gammaproteobacteria bacterium]
GDMLLGALIDAGVPAEVIARSIDALHLQGVIVSAEKVVKRGIAATKAHVMTPREHAHRHLPDVIGIIEGAALDSAVKAKACAVFHTLATAEGAVHAIPIEQVHFHEVGALDAIADVVGVVAGFAHLNAKSVSCRGIPMSHGTVKCEHGLLPVPAPAVLRLMQGVPTYPIDIDGETVTPTAAALLRELVTDWRDAPAMTITRQGYGAGTKEFPRANVLRLVIGTSSAASTDVETLELLSTNLDDMNPEWLPPLLERLLAAGALDAWLTPILMKKGRPAHTLSVLCAPMLVDVLRSLVYQHSTTLGVRQQTVQRSSLPRTIHAVDTPWGAVSVKVARLPGGEQRAVPEYADCRRISEAHGVSLSRIYEAAVGGWQRGEFTASG